MVFSFTKKEPQAPPPDPMVLLAEAQEFLKTEDFEGALAKFDELCALPVQSPLPLLSRATCRLQLKKYDGVVEDCEKVLKFLNTDIEGHSEEGCTTVHSLALMRMAKAFKELGKTDEAKSAVMRKNVIEHKLGRDKNEDENDEDDEERSKRMQKEKDAAEEWKEKGNAEFKEQNWNKALEYYRNGLGYDLYNPKLHSNACLTLVKLKRFTQALKYAEQCILLEPNWVKGYYLKGLILSSESKIEQARAALQKALSIEPDNTQVKALLDEVEARVDYVESRLRRRKAADKQSSGANHAGDKDSDSANEKEAGDNVPVEDVDSDEDYCNDDGCRTPKKIKFKITRKQIIDSAVEIGAAVLGIAAVWWFVSDSD
ncbi:hypothetical protein LPJ64_005135 [Coemansia asiatica]|uniref:Uncharacterized protein n=1 Tax=Coemansia asiatica TaxID=1052880 RepID=A0A9W7XGL4_9FUNG|nr:hypothetical protein LPJ64_005135 [Coemansia asiatica]